MWAYAKRLGRLFTTLAFVITFQHLAYLKNAKEKEFENLTDAREDDELKM